MLGSEVIKQIQNLIDEYGDLPIEISLNGSDQEEVKEICYGGFGSTVEKAKEAIIQLWNSRVNKKDTVYILGDLAFGEVEDKRKLFQRLNGNKVLILGNHDKVPDHLKCYFNHITQIKNIKFKKSVYNFLHKDLEVIMCHFPMLSWEHKDKGSVMIHGHCHGKVDKINTDSKELRVDVGIDGNLANYDLISLEKLANHFTKIEKDNEHGMVK